MAQEYTVTAVSQQPPKEWSGKYGPMRTYKLRLSGLGEEAIELNRKPDSPAPKVGDKFYGNIQATDFGKRLQVESQSGNGGRGGYQRDDKEIRAQMAVKAATDYCAQQGIKPEEIGAIAQHLYDLVDMLKGTDKPQVPADDLKRAVDRAFEADTQPVNNNEIPF